MKIPFTILCASALLLAVPAAFADGAGALYAKHCASCHGKDGKGQTKMGKQTKAADYTSPAGQAWSDSEGVKVILNGKDKMKGFASKGVTEADAKALVSYIRNFKK
jgi:mono/diheme cytochrome c family protein